jgi:hypothetical protein
VVERLIKKIKNNAPNEILIIVPYEDLFDEINQVPQGDHAGIREMSEALSEKFDNIRKNQFCRGCNEKRAKIGSKQVVVKPIISTGFMKRGQVDVITRHSNILAISGFFIIKPTPYHKAFGFGRHV